MVAGGSRHGAEASSSHAGPPGSSDPAVGPGQGQEHVDAPSPLFTDAHEEQQLWEELHGHGASLNRALNEALQIHDGPVWRVFQVCCRPLDCCFLPCSVVFAFVFRGATLIGLRLLVAGAGDPRPRQVRRSRPDER
jgi:hypothetical protein